jgi:hypothetical protein
MHGLKDRVFDILCQKRMPFFGRFGVNFKGIFGERKLEIHTIFITQASVLISQQIGSP